MEQSNRIQRSEVWEKIYKIVKQIPTKEVDADCMDAPSAATEIEKLFLKLLPIQHVSDTVYDPDWEMIQTAPHGIQYKHRKTGETKWE